MVRKHEEEERPFEPSRPPTWRGSSKDLVVNPGGFERDLESLLHDYYGHLDTELSEEEMLKELLTTFRRKNTEDALERANELLEGHGVEALGPVDMHDGPPYLYINFGDPYVRTIMYSRDDNKVFVASWGDVWSEEGEPRLFDEGWESWLGSEFAHKLEEEAISADPDHDTDDPVPGGAQEKALELIESDDSDGLKELFQRAMTRAQNVGGKYPEVVQESDGITVTHMGSIVAEAVDMLKEGWRPGTWEGHSTRKHRPNATRVPRPKFRVGQRVCDLDGERPGTIELVGSYDDYIGGYRYKVQVDGGTRHWHNETNMKLIGAHRENARSRFSVGDTVYPRFLLRSAPELGRDTRAVVREVRVRDKKMRVERDDGGRGSWWVHFDDMRKQGEPA